MKREAGSPHGYKNGGDVSRAVRSASGDPASSMPERTLIYGYRKAELPWAPDLPRRVTKCVCGGEIEGADDPIAIRSAVELHNESTQHQQWRAWQE